jgi:hypothetical protein
MRSKFCLCVVLLASLGYAKEPKTYQRGKLLQMESVTCGTDEKDGSSLAADVLGTESGHKRTQELLCQEYVLQADSVNYRIRPRDQKHPVLLPIGEYAQFRLEKSKMLVRIQAVDNVDNKEREFIVVSMKPRSDSSSAEAPVHLNHLQ